MKIAYVDRRFMGPALDVVDQANDIIDEYVGQGYDLTLRQLFYQFVARALLPNTERSYKRLQSIVSDARMAGLIDWGVIKDRTRTLRSLPHWDGPREIMSSVVSQFRIDKWARQEVALEVWIEKQALVGVIDGVCDQHQVPYFACRGYVSQSFMHEAAERMARRVQAGRAPIVLHLGDHDPSGIDMTRDIEERLSLFVDGPVEVRRLALNMDQVRLHGPPPNPAKLSDVRAGVDRQGNVTPGSYVDLHGYESWELDSLPPQVISDLVGQEIEGLRDDGLWDDALEEEESGRAKLATAMANM